MDTKAVARGDRAARQAEVLESLRQAAAERGRRWTVREWREARRKPTVAEVVHAFGTWSAAWAHAGFEAYRSGRGPTPEEAILRALALAAREGHGPRLTVSAYARWRAAHGGPSASTVVSRFGSWRAALEAAGVAPEDVDQAIVESLRRLWQEKGRRPTWRDWKRYAARPCSVETLLSRFGSWRQALLAAEGSGPVLPAQADRSAALRRLAAVDPSSLGERQARIAVLAAQGLGLSAIARELGISRQRVHQIVKAAVKQPQSSPGVDRRPDFARA
ncbi:MAG: helix-turn-helix domain-containing protein [Firmicutes bacterium]|nr:helix-turn-helix domain-containing protein [Bacillota bacterium]